MFKLEETLARWRQQMRAAGITSNECLEELEAHLREDFERSIQSELSPETAFEHAVQHLGHEDALAKEFQKSQREERRRWVYRGLCFSLGVLAIGAAFGYFVLLPMAMTATSEYMKWLGFSPFQLAHARYIHFAAKVVLCSTFCFEVPIMVLTLVKTGMIKLHWLSKGRKYVLILNLVIAAIMAGPGVIPQLAMFSLLQGFYQLGLVLSRSVTGHHSKCGPGAGCERGL